MSTGYRVKLLYLAALFALALLAILARLYSMQVSNYSTYKNKAEITTYRPELLFPSRAKILDARGRVVASNESIWDCYVDWGKLTDPEGILIRALASPESYPALDEVVGFQTQLDQFLEQSELPYPRRARTFFALWQVRKGALSLLDQDRVLTLLSDMLSRPFHDVADAYKLVVEEVDAIAQSVGDYRNAERGVVQAAYLQAQAALRDPEYWERIRRFPKSIAFQSVLVERLECMKQRLELYDALHENIDDHEELVEDILESAYESAQGHLNQLRAESTASHDLDFNFLSDVERREDTEATKSWTLVVDQFHKWVSEYRSSKNVDAILDRIERVVDRMEEEEGRDLERRLERLHERILLPYMDDYQSRWTGYLTPDEHGKARGKSNPLLLARRVRRDVIDALEVHAEALPGVRCEPRSQRVYPHAELFAHVLGKLQQPDVDLLATVLRREELSENLSGMIDQWFAGDVDSFRDAFRHSVARQEVGIAGLERIYDSILTGRCGARVTYADARGQVQSTPYEQNPEPAEPIHLTLDMELQEFIGERVSDWEPKLKAKALAGPQRSTWQAVGTNRWSLRGAFVMLDVETGAVLALANFPSYDPDLLLQKSEEGQVYHDRIYHGDDDLPKNYYWLKQAPLLNRAVSGRYAPGSTFKILSAIALLEDGVIDANSTFDETEKLIQGRTFRLRTGHPAGANIDVVTAIIRSSNGFFWHFSEEIPRVWPHEKYGETLLPWAQRFGFAQRPGIDLPYQTNGNMPPATKGGVDGGGELALLSIGQGQNLASPLQVARFMAAVANRGKLHSPFLVADGNREEVRNIEVSAETWDLIHQGMIGVVADAHGTARRSDICREAKVAGKTGTAQIHKFTAQNGKVYDVPDHAWFAGFAPYDKPKVAFAMLAEYSGLYGGDVADIAGEIVQHYLESQRSESEE